MNARKGIMFELNKLRENNPQIKKEINMLFKYMYQYYKNYDLDNNSNYSIIFKHIFERKTKITYEEIKEKLIESKNGFAKKIKKIQTFSIKLINNNPKFKKIKELIPIINYK